MLPPTPEGMPADIVRADDTTHSRYRRLLSHAFSAKALEEQHSLIMSYVNLLIRGLHENSSKPQDLVAWYNWTTFDVISDLSFGKSFGCLKDQRYHPWVTTILDGINGGVAISAAQRYGLGGLLVKLIPKSMTKKFEEMWDYTSEAVAHRLERGTDRVDFMSHLMRNDKNRTEMTQPAMVSNAVTLVVAGSETTASVLAAVSYYLMVNPEMLRKVTDEVRNSFHSEDEIDCSSVGKLEYMLAVLKEGLRIYPPAPSSIPRMVLGQGDTIDGKFVPPNVSTSTSSSLLNNALNRVYVSRSAAALNVS